MSAILKFRLPKKGPNNYAFSEVNYLNYTKNTQFCIGKAFTCNPKTRGNLDYKPWTHSTPLKHFITPQMQKIFLLKGACKLQNIFLNLD